MARIINKLRNKKGFTLIELVVVLAVLAIIMAIAVPRFGGVREDAKKDADSATLASIAKLAEFEHVRLNKDKNVSLDGDTSKKLVASNFIGDTIFQTDYLKGYKSSDFGEITFVNGSVETITVDKYDFDFSNGKFEIPDEKSTP